MRLELAAIGLAATAVLAWPEALLAQKNNLKFERISLEQGLSQNTIYGILQDRQGFMWFGTQDGLNKFDGYDFKVYKHDPHHGDLSRPFPCTLGWHEQRRAQPAGARRVEPGKRNFHALSP